MSQDDTGRSNSKIKWQTHRVLSCIASLEHLMFWAKIRKKGSLCLESLGFMDVHKEPKKNCDM